MAGDFSTPLSLADQTGLFVLKRLRKKTVFIELEYMVQWLPRLNSSSYDIEATMNLAHLNTDDVVSSFTQKLQELQETKSTKRKSRKGKHENVRTVAAEPLLFKSGIPDGVEPEEYIRYRKCLFINSIKKLRDDLMNNLSPPAVDHLLHLITLLHRRSVDTNEEGVFTLQSILLTHCTSSFYINSSSFYNHFKNQVYFLLKRTVRKSDLKFFLASTNVVA